jgi:hypothetical protein
MLYSNAVTGRRWILTASGCEEQWHKCCRAVWSLVSTVRLLCLTSELAVSSHWDKFGPSVTRQHRSPNATVIAVHSCQFSVDSSPNYLKHAHTHTHTHTHVQYICACLPIFMWTFISYVKGRAEAEGIREQGGRADSLRVLENRVVGQIAGSEREREKLTGHWRKPRNE